MDVNQQKLRLLIQNTDNAFEMFRQNPTSADFAACYEQAKNELNEYLANMRQSLEQRARSR